VAGVRFSVARVLFANVPVESRDHTRASRAERERERERPTPLGPLIKIQSGRPATLPCLEVFSFVHRVPRTPPGVRRRSSRIHRSSSLVEFSFLVDFPLPPSLPLPSPSLSSPSFAKGGSRSSDPTLAALRAWARSVTHIGKVCTRASAINLAINHSSRFSARSPRERLVSPNYVWLPPTTNVSPVLQFSQSREIARLRAPARTDTPDLPDTPERNISYRGIPSSPARFITGPLPPPCIITDANLFLGAEPARGD